MHNSCYGKINDSYYLVLSEIFSHLIVLQDRINLTLLKDHANYCNLRCL